MKSRRGTETARRRAGEHAAAEVTDGMVVGLGTGSTAAHAVRALGRAAADGLAVRCVPTSRGTRVLAVEVGLDLVGLDEVDAHVDLAIDGADQVADGVLLKGGGAAHAREKIVAASAERVTVVVDETKIADVLDRPVPVEVLPDGAAHVAARVREAGGSPTLRTAEGKDGPVVTDNGNHVLDCAFGPIDDPAGLEATLASIPGAVATGLFVGIADEIHVGSDEEVRVIDC